MFDLCNFPSEDCRNRHGLVYAFEILPALMQLVHTRMRLGLPLTNAFTACRLTFQRRFVTLCACEMLLPNCGPLPQTSHTCAISICSRLCLQFPRQPELPKAALIRPDLVTQTPRRAKGRMKTHPPFSLQNLQYTPNRHSGQTGTPSRRGTVQPL